MEQLGSSSLRGERDSAAASVLLSQARHQLCCRRRQGDWSQVEQVCITPNVPPFLCKNPEQFLFWDGVHATKAVHAFFAVQAANVLGTELRDLRPARYRGQLLSGIDGHQIRPEIVVPVSFNDAEIS
jgi:hypothetical protein